MEYHEIHNFINKTSTTSSVINASTAIATNDGDSSSLGYSSDDSFDSYDTPLRQTNILEHQARRYYQLPVSPLPQKKQHHWRIAPLPHPSAEKLGSNSTLSKKFVQGVQSLKNKVASFSPSSMSSASEVSLASSMASDESHSLGPSSSYGHPYDTSLHNPQSEISNKSVSGNIPVPSHSALTIDQETALQLSPIPNLNLNHCTPLQQNSPQPHDQPQPGSHHKKLIAMQRPSLMITTHELLLNRTLSPTRLSSVSKKSRVRKRLNSIWRRHLFKPVSTPRPTRKLNTISTNKGNHMAHKGDITVDDVRVTQNGHRDEVALAFKVPPDRSSPVSSLASSYQFADLGAPARKTQSMAPSLLLAQVSEHIQKLQCLVDIEVQLVEDHQRDINFYTNQLEQLNHDVQYLNHKVSMTLSNIENNMDPLQANIHRTTPLLSQLHTKHQLIVTKFTTDALRNRAKDTFNSLQSKVKSAEQQLERWDTITFWTTLISVILLTCLLVLWLVHSTGVIVTSVLVLLLVFLFYDSF